MKTKPTITIKDGITLTNFPRAVLKKVQEKLEVPNDTYYMLMRKNGRHPWGIDPVHKFYTIDGNEMKIPRGMEDTLLNYMDLIGLEYNLRRRTISKKLDFTPSGIDLRDYQKPLVEAAVKRVSGMLVAGTGTGKSVMAIEIIRRLGKTATILVPKLTLAEQFALEMKEHWGYECGMINGSVKEIKGVTVSTVQSLASNKALLQEVVDNTSVLIVDECFVGSTRVLTKDGYKEIKRIKQGDLVWTPVGFRKVNKTIKNKTKSLLKIKIGGKNIIATPNHPFLCNSGWKKAKDLSKNDIVLIKDFVYDIMRLDIESLAKKYETKTNKKNELQNLQDRIYFEISQETPSVAKTVQQTVCKQVELNKCGKNKKTKENSGHKKKQRKEIENSKRNFSKKTRTQEAAKRKNEEKQPNAEKRVKGKNEKNTKTHWPFTNYTGWKRERGASTTKNFIWCAWERLVYGIPRKNKKEKWLPNLLQNRHSKPEKNDSNRSRWGFPRITRKTKAGQKERKISYGFGVESVKIQKQRGFRKHRKGTYVYNLEVKDCPMYVVGEMVVHNCQGAVAKSTMRVFNSFEAEHYYGLTASPDRDDSLAPGVYFLFGEEPICEYHQTQLEPKIEVYQTGHKILPHFEYHRMIEDMVDCTERNRLIAGLIGGASHEGRKVLVLTKRIAHYEKFKEFFPPCDAFRYIDSDDKNRDELLMQMKKGRVDYKVIFGTTSLLSVGVDIPSLDTLILTCDMKGQVLTTQSVGRVLRSFSGKKQPVIIDFHDGYKWDFGMKNDGENMDVFNPILHKQFKARLELYKLKGWTIDYKGGILPYKWLHDQD